MNTSTITASRTKRRNAMALILVIITVALLSILIVAIFSITRTEYKATQNFVAARSAKQLGDMAVSIVQAQIQNGQNAKDDTGIAKRTIHATQPGMVRVYDPRGFFLRAFKLYSSSQMKIESPNNEQAVFSSVHQVPQDWNSNQNRARYVDLNEPVIRQGITAGTQAVYFPIIDPRAAYDGTNPVSGQRMVPVEGFSYENQTPVITGASQVSYSEVVLPAQAAGNPDNLRLPMPVEWLYMLQDGTTGTLNAGGEFVSSTSVQPSTTNPIVGRVAFWTDDESCKVNVNTASEPTFFAPPYFYHKRDAQWANFPGAAGEFQRYPGHPATVALSAILAPGIEMDPMALNANVQNIVQTKELIYDLIPKVARGGSMSGTRPFLLDAFASANNLSDFSDVTDTASARSERLLASVDEMLFKDRSFDSSNGREAALIPIPGAGNRLLFDHDTLERSRFFLTAHSRSPEFTAHSMPRVCIWPVADESLGQSRRSSFDNMIALCSTLRAPGSSANAAQTYFFRRAQAHSGTFDLVGTNTLRRNQDLLNYIYNMMTTLRFPVVSNYGSSMDFRTKYGQDNAAQIALQIFDYVRSTNLYDGVLARGNDGTSGLGKSGTALYNLRDQLDGTQITYTDFRMTPKASNALRQGTQAAAQSLGGISDEASVFPGHGQVTPARWDKNGKTLQGFGRMFTISEIGFQVICTADGKNDEKYPVLFGTVQSGGGSAPVARDARNPDEGDANTAPVFLAANAPRLDGTKAPNRWYSNFPPLTPAGYFGGKLYGCDPADPERHPFNHPGYSPENWNMTLDPDKPLSDGVNPPPGGGPVRPAEKRIQVMLMLEAFCPMLGWTKIFPEFAITLDAQFMRSIYVVDASGSEQQLFRSNQDVVVKSNENLYQDNDVYSLGGHAGPTALAGGRSVPGWNSQIGDDTDPYVSGQAARIASAKRYIGNGPGVGQPHEGLNDWGLVSSFVTVRRDQPIQLRFKKRDLVIKIYDKHDRAGKNAQEVQTIQLNIDDMTLPVPALAYSGERRFGGQPVTDPVNAGEINHYWTIDQYGREAWRRSLQAPHWWCFNRMGCLNRMRGDVDPNYNGTGNLYATGPLNNYDFTGGRDQLLTGRLDTENRYSTGAGTWYASGTRRGIPIIPPEGSGKFQDELGNDWTGFDVIRTLVPAVGDYRVSGARRVMENSMWMKHPVWEASDAAASNALNRPRTIHSFTTHWATTEPGVVLPFKNTSAPFSNWVNRDQMLVASAQYDDRRVPDLPPSEGYARVANSYGDFDNGIANSRDGAYINKTDEGNYYAGNFTRYNTTKFYRSGYFFEPWRNSDDWRSGVFMTPNRMMSSPVVFGSLPTGVWPGGTHQGALQNSNVTGFTGNIAKPWQTLLFRPYTKSHLQRGKPSSNPSHPGDNNPRDHFILDLFYMPVVEPYAISEPLSVAGRLNLNYQIMPFTNITRATGMHALMKGEFMTTIPNNDDVNLSKEFYAPNAATVQANWSGKGDQFYDEATNTKFWHRPIDVEKTLYQFDQKFRNVATASNQRATIYRGLFRTPSQICEMHLIPDVSAGTSTGGEQLGNVGSISKTTTGTSLQTTMEEFWQNHCVTGDNTRERPYSNLYARVTTRSNTFRVHMRAQVIRKARSVAPDKFDPDKDAIVADYRGSSLIERYIDPNDPELSNIDYATSTDPVSLRPLDSFFRFRTLESKRFSP